MAQQIDIVANLLMKVDGAEAGINKLKNSLSKLKMPEGLENSFKKSFANLDTLFARYKSQVEKGFDTKADVTNFNKTSKALDAELTRISKHFTELTGKEINFKVKSDDIIRTEKELEKLIEQKAQLSKESLKFEIKGGKDGFKDVESILLKLKEAAGRTKTGENIGGALDFLKSGDVQTAISLLEKASVSVKRFKQEKQDAFKSETGFDMSNILTTMISMLSGAEGKFGDVNAKITETKNNLTNFQAEQLQKAGNYAEELSSKMENSASEIRQADGAMQDFARSSQSMSQQLGDLQQSTQYFFSLRNMINLLKRGINEAVQSVKELDKAMTDTAVVTDFSVGDMWKDLPKYTQLANELGATTKGAYETMTLYYQQGLNQQQAFALGAETMKMARIAGLDYAETTDMMTAALRGFNMELDEISAKRVNDVYSKLAAITASDTEELGTAMQRTASIAASAGASFEGTTAFLAQAIETTREPAENIGTAMKTIVARFQEMKKNPLEISEVEGEEVNYNKIDAALKTIGVDLKDTNGQFRNFDEVMLDISAKWDTLSQSQQRYIATTAAGSRQQSRFIAMVSDYDRTMQLMEAANNSAGASEEQFGKTAESLEFKLNKLHNAWELFTMGIANNGIIKGAVDGITALLTGVNNLIDSLSLGIGPVKSLLSLLTAFTGLKVGGKLINSLIGGLGGLVDPQSSIKQGLKTGFFGSGRSQLQADRFTNPIIKAINGLIPHIDKSATAKTDQPYKFTELGNYNKARKELSKQSGRLGGKGYTVGQLTDIIDTNKLNKEQQKNFFQSSPGLKKNLVDSLSQLYSDIGMDPKVSKGLIKGFKQGDLALDEVLDVSKLQTSLSNKVAQVTKESGWAAGQQLQNKYWQQYYNEAIEQGMVDSDKINSYVNQKMESTKIPIEPKQLEEFYGKVQQLTPLQKFSNTIGQVGAGLSAAGMAMQQFGAQISQVSPILGAFVSQMGNVLTTAGSLASAIPALLADPFTAAATAAIAAGAALVLGAKAYTDNIKKKGEEVVQTYKNTTNELKDSISQIESYQSELVRLSAGVDENGLNISLDTSEYERYKEIVNDLIEQNPEIIKGWNSEGQAIIDVNSALKDTIALKREALQKEKDTYLSDISGQQLINARNVTAGYVDTRDRGPYDQSDFLKKAKKVGESISKSGVADAAIAAGFDLEKIKQGDTQAIRFLQEHYSLLESVYKQGGKEISSDLSSQIGELSDGLKAYDEAVAPLVDYLKEYATEQNLFADLPIELTSAFNEGIKSIAGKNLDISEMKGLTNLLSLQLRDAFDEAKPLLDEADAALDTFTQDLNETAYDDKAGDIASQLRDMADEAEALGHTEVAQWYETQASRIEKAISNATESIAENIDTLADNVANAKTNFEALGESIDDYYTLADQAHGLVETALEEKNTEGKGSKTFWNTYRGLASKDTYNEHDIDKAISNMKQFQKYFTEGAEGSRAFAQKLIDSQDDIIKGEGDLAGKRVSDFFKMAEDGTMSVTDEFNKLTDEQYAQLASVFDLSADGFTAILNKLRQFGDLDFTDPAGVRRALALDDRSVKTTAEVAGQEGVKRLYYGQSVLDAETADLEPEIKEGLVKDLTVQGSIQLPTGAENLLTAKTEGGKEGSLLAQFVKDTQGRDNQVENVMKALIQSGEYNKDELQTIHGELTKEGGLLAGADDSNKHFDDLYNGITESLEDPTGAETNNILGGIDATVDTIAGILAAGKVKEGYLPDVAKQSAQLQKDLIGETGIVDSWAQLFARGKDEKGNVITDDAIYRELDAKLTEVQTANNNYIKELEAGKQAAIDRGATQSEIDAFDAEIEAAKDNAALIELYLANAATNYDNIVKETEKASGTLLSQLQTTSEQNLSKSEQQAEVTNALQTFASNLQNLGFNAEQIAGIFKDNFGIELELKNGEFATDVGDQIQEQVSGKDFDINAVLNISSINLAGGAAAKGKNNTPSAIRRVGTMARGSKKHGYTINGEPTLTGELGPELVWEPKQNAAYMVGEHGPQFANLSKNAVVWNAKQTKKIQKNSKGVNLLGTGARGIHSFGTMAFGNFFGGGGAGGGTTIPGVLNLNANATILGVIPPTPEPEIPVKAKLEVEGNSGGFLDKIFGGGKSGPSINVAANVTSISANTQPQTIPVIGNITQLKNATTATNIDATATVTQVTKAAQIAGEPIQVKATATATKVENKASGQTPKVSAGAQTMNVTANTSAAQAKINQLISLFNKTYTLKYKASGPSSIKVPISANFTGSWKKTVTINKSGAKGINNKGFGSLAKGSRYGTVGPNNRGGLTLTGERGFEIAWLPSENRSMILGANGPQMLELPKDAVVFTNKQSKKILNQKAIPAGSHATTTARGSNIFKYLDVSSGSSSKGKSSSKGSSSSSSGSSSSSSSSKTTINHFSIEEVIRFNLDKKIEAITSKIKKLTEEIDKNLKKIGTTALDITDSTQEQIKNLKSIKAFNDSLIASYQKDLNAIDLSKYMMKVSYTDDNGESQDYTFDAQSYMYQTDGMPFINDSAIRQLGSPGLQKAVTDAMKGLIDPLISGLQKARDAADDAQKQIEDLAEKFADTFYGWKNELTEIYDLTQRIENETSFTDRFTSQIELELSKLGAGFGETEKAISNINAVLNRSNQTIKEQIENQKQLIDARKRELDNALSAQDELDKIEAYRNSEAYAKASDEEREAVIKKLADEYNIAENALAYIKNVQRELDGSVTYDIDWEGFAEANRQNPFNKETYDALKSYLDDLNSAATDFNNSVKDQTDLLKQTYDDLKKYQDTIVDFEGTLLKGVEEQIKNDTENAKKLSDSISNALKDLLDEVKRKLDERRKQEDNAKTERDIAQKQQRLAALRANTSGGNQVEIAQLEKEIADAQQSYGRTLEDQLLDKLQQQGDEAKLQRERQIELAEASNEIGAANNRELVNSWLRDPQKYKEQIKAAWLESQGYDEKGYAEQKSLLNQWEVEWTNFLTAVEQTGFNESTENIEKNTYTLVKLLADATGAVVDVTERNTETLKDLTKDVEGAKKAYSKGVDAKTLKDAFGFDAKTLAGGGYTPSDLKGAGFGVSDLVSAGTADIKTLKELGFDASQIKGVKGVEGATDASAFKEAGFTADDLLKAKFGKEVVKDLFDAKALKEAGFEIADLKDKFNLSQLKEAGYDLSSLKKAGFSADEFGASGISYADAKAAGFKAADLKNVAQYAKQAAAELQPKVSQGRDLAYGSQGSDVKLLQQTLNKLGIRDNSGNSLDVDGDFGQHTREAVINFQKKYRNKASKTLSADGVVGYYTKEAFKALGYKTGGLADYTGPAWLDGTPSKPELVLNATDTKNFLALRDVLSSAMKSTSSVANAYGGNATYEININVDKLTSDYDVDRVAERVKKIIVKDSSYRNVTQVRNFR